MSVLIDPKTGLEYYIKQPGENRLYTMDFAPLLGDKVIQSVQNLVITNQGYIEGSADLLNGATSHDGVRYVQVRLDGGTDREDYKITITILDTGGNTLEGDGVLKVREL